MLESTLDAVIPQKGVSTVSSPWFLAGFPTEISVTPDFTCLPRPHYLTLCPGTPGMTSVSPLETSACQSSDRVGVAGHGGSVCNEVVKTSPLRRLLQSIGSCETSWRGGFLLIEGVAGSQVHAILCHGLVRSYL